MSAGKICIDKKCEHAIIPREEWGAVQPKETIKEQEYKNLKKELRRIVVHHSAFTPQFPPAALQNYSMKTRGFDDLGYHFYIMEDGTIYEARELKYGGAHAGECKEATDTHNFKLDPDYGSIGIAVAGCFDPRQCRESHTPTEAQKMALGALVVYLRKQFPKIGKEDVLAHSEVKQKVIVAAGLTPASRTKRPVPGN